MCLMNIYDGLGVIMYFSVKLYKLRIYGFLRHQADDERKGRNCILGELQNETFGGVLFE